MMTGFTGCHILGMHPIYFGTSLETNDLIIDCLELWWSENQKRLSNIMGLMCKVTALDSSKG